MKKKLWENKKKKQKRSFEGFYKYIFNKEGSVKERTFNLTNGKKTYTFESWQMAKELGWTTK